MLRLGDIEPKIDIDIDDERDNVKYVANGFIFILILICIVNIVAYCYAVIKVYNNIDSCENNEISQTPNETHCEDESGKKTPFLIVAFILVAFILGIALGVFYYIAYKKLANETKGLLYILKVIALIVLNTVILGICIYIIKKYE
jgi:uncharacterized BrkB/YihY/UPF0761 family membrane protein